MKYLIKNQKEFVISLGVFATILLVLLWSIWSIFTGNLDYKNLIAIIGAIFEIFGWYYNMPTSEENCIHTGEMRLEKAFNKNGTDGEDFFEEFEDKFEEQFEEENEEADE